MRGPWQRAVLTAGCLAAGCAVGGYADAGGSTTHDAGPLRIDGGRRDGGTTDARVGGDASAIVDGAAQADASIDIDASTGSDAGALDAGAPDAGRTLGTVAIGQPCGSTAECVAGASCWAGLCHRECTSDAGCPGRGSFCFIQPDPAMPASLCTLPCEPSTTAGCPSGFMCAPLDMGAVWGTECFPEGSVGDGGSCSRHTDCQATLGCNQGDCQRLCNFDGPPNVCSPCTWACFFCGWEQPAVEDESYGFCG